MAIDNGVLYVAATPIGNLKDLTLRVLDVLKSSDLIISEDTRETQKLLDHYGIKANQISYRDQNHDKSFLSILNELVHGKTVTLVCDSGTPTISDPGYKLIRDLRKNSFTNIVTLPGPSALISALSVSGLPTDKFCFLGFLPKKPKARHKEVEKVKNFEGTIVLYESPQRVFDLLNTVYEILGERYCAICAELTKINERVIQGSVAEILKSFDKIETRGEFVILIAKDGFAYD